MTNLMYKAFRFVAKTALLPFAILSWLIIFPIMMSLALCDNDDFDGFANEMKNFFSTIADYFR